MKVSYTVLWIYKINNNNNTLIFEVPYKDELITSQYSSEQMRIITFFWAIWKQQQRCRMTLPNSQQASAWASIQHQACLALFLCSDHSSTLLKWQVAPCFTCFVQTWSSDNGWKYSHPNNLVPSWAVSVGLTYLFNVLTHISRKQVFFPSLRFSWDAGLELK